MERRELTEELNERSLPKGVGNRRVEGEGWVFFRQVPDPGSLRGKLALEFAKCY